MRNYLSLLACSVLLLSVEVVHAQATLPAPASNSNNADSFANIATLGEEIAVAQRKIQAMTLKNSLDALEAQQSMGTFAYKVLRVEGFNDTLYAVLTDDSGVIYQVGPGDIIGNQYRVSLIRPYSVGVFDINTRKTYAVPFVMGSAEALTNSYNESVAPMAVTNQVVTHK